MTSLFLIYQTGHCGGSWFSAVCHKHPTAKIVVAGEAYNEQQLDFTYPCSSQEYDRHLIGFMQRQITAGDDAVGVMKGFFDTAVRFVLQGGGRIVQVVRNPITLIGWKMGRYAHKGATLLNKPMETEQDRFEASVLYYRHLYAGFLSREYPIIRIEDWNRSLANDGEFFRRSLEFITQVPCPQSHVEFVQKNLPPSQSYQLEFVWEGGAVKGVNCAPFPVEVQVCQSLHETWRHGWQEDGTPLIYWDDWGEKKRQFYASEFADIEEALGYKSGEFPASRSYDWIEEGKL